MRYYPAFLDLRGKLCVIVGGGAVAARKAESLARAGAVVRVVAPDVRTDIRRMRGVEWKRGRFAARDLDGAALVIAATSDARVQRAVWHEANRRGILCNSADSAARSNFLAPAAFSRGDLHIAVSTGGASPALARRIRQELERLFGPEYSELLSLLRELRPQVLADVAAGRHSEQFRKMVDSGALDLLRKGRRREARELLERIAVAGRRSSF